MKFYPRLILAAALLAGVSGCAQLGYTVQAMQGQLSLMSQAKPIDDWLSDPLTTNELKERLRRVRSIRTFFDNADGALKNFDAKLHDSKRAANS